MGLAKTLRKASAMGATPTNSRQVAWKSLQARPNFQPWTGASDSVKRTHPGAE